MAAIRGVDRVYYGVYIHKNTEPGYRLRWTALCYGERLAADTLAGIKHMIRERSPHRRSTP